MGGVRRGGEDWRRDEERNKRKGERQEISSESEEYMITQILSSAAILIDGQYSVPIQNCTAVNTYTKN